MFEVEGKWRCREGKEKKKIALSYDVEKGWSSKMRGGE